MDNSIQKTTLYRYFDSEDRLLYVGITKNIFDRQNAHAKTQPWWHEVNKATFEHLDSREEALSCETEVIAREFPKYNKSGPTIDPELRKHLIEIISSSLDDEWHEQLSNKINAFMSEVNDFSQQPEAYKLAFAIDSSIDWDEHGEYRMIYCPNCQKIIDSSWFRFASAGASEAIIEEYYL
jgi:predicted GIY-YIG superfamily endonuclease